MVERDNERCHKVQNPLRVRGVLGKASSAGPATPTEGLRKGGLQRAPPAQQVQTHCRFQPFISAPFFRHFPSVTEETNNGNHSQRGGMLCITWPGP